MARIPIEKVAEKQLELQEKFMQAAARAVVRGFKYSILSAQDILAEVKRESKLFCK